MIELAKQLDPKFDRSYFVFSSFERQLNKFNSSRDLNRFLTSNVVDSHVCLRDGIIFTLLVLYLLSHLSFLIIFH